MLTLVVLKDLEHEVVDSQMLHLHLSPFFPEDGFELFGRREYPFDQQLNPFIGYQASSFFVCIVKGKNPLHESDEVLRQVQVKEFI